MRLFHTLILLLVFEVFAGLASVDAFGGVGSGSGLGKGDLIPNMTMLLHIGPDSTMEIKLADLHKRLVIFDFWDTRCSACIAALPRMSELMNKYGDRLQVIVVCKQSFADVKSAYNRLRKIGIPNNVIMAWDKLSFLTGDTVMNSLFPHSGNPMHVWADNNMVCRFITYGMNTTNTTVREFLEHGDCHGLDELCRRSFASLKCPSFDNRLKTDKGTNSLFTSAIESRFEHGDLGTLRISSVDSLGANEKCTRFINYSILDLYREVFNVPYSNISSDSYIPDDRFFIISKQMDRFVTPREEKNLFDWMQRNLFCYSIRTESNVSEYAVRSYMQKDLDSRFHLKSSVKNVAVWCYVIKKSIKNSNVSLLDTSVSFSNGDVGVFRDRYMSEIVARLGFLVQKENRFTPVIDDTGFKGSIKILLPFYDQNMSIFQLKYVLNKKGFDIARERRYINELVLEDS